MEEQEMSDEEALMKLAQAMKGNEPTQEDKQNVHIFLHNVAVAKDTTKTANLRDDNELNELGVPAYTVRGAKDMALISEKIMDNDYFKEYFEKEAENTLSTSLSREGFLIKQATTTTKQVADITKRKKINKGWFGTKKVEESGGDTTQSS
ncbi:MAG TPA: hypothetical protein ENG87_05030 [Candidatus Pacearchaeota archaeon]|nr:hypothetical protein [Candidatus Pacearchaeota archaeon]